MRPIPGVLQHGDPSVGQRLTTDVDMHRLGGAAELQNGLESLRKQIASERRTGLQSIFVGAPGNGQVLAAASLGRAAGVSVFRIDLSAVVSRYIGETEKNLDRVFDHAPSASAILFFDEADALLDKRTEVSDAHDRYANAEAAYLLHKLEAHPELAILAIRSLANIDPAFLRRLPNVLHFQAALHVPSTSIS